MSTVQDKFAKLTDPRDTPVMRAMKLRSAMRAQIAEQFPKAALDGAAEKILERWEQMAMRESRVTNEIARLMMPIVVERAMEKIAGGFQ